MNKQPIALTMIPAINPMFRLQWEQAQNSYVLLYPEGMVKLNDSAGEILALIDNRRSTLEIITTLQTKFAAAGDLSQDIIEFLEEAYEQQWITL